MYACPKRWFPLKWRLNSSLFNDKNRTHSFYLPHVNNIDWTCELILITPALFLLWINFNLAVNLSMKRFEIQFAQFVSDDAKIKGYDHMKTKNLRPSSLRVCQRGCAFYTFSPLKLSFKFLSVHWKSLFVCQTFITFINLFKPTARDKDNCNY